jgi:type IV pilus assembly protein PilC
MTNALKTPKPIAPRQTTKKSGDAFGAKKKNPWWKYEITPEKVKLEEVMNFSRQCAAFVRSGVSLIESLDVIGEETKDKQLRKILIDCASRIRNGSNFSDALSVYRSALPNYYVPMIQAAELTGRLDEVLDQLSEYLDRDIESKRKIKSALTYPTIVAILSVVTVVVLSTFVLPRFEGFFNGLHAKLPLSTRILLGFTRFLSRTRSVLGMVSIGMFLATVAFLRTHIGKLFRDRALLRIPGLGIVLRYSIVERFCRILSSMVQAGVPLPEAMLVANESSNNRRFRAALREAREAMIRGEGLAAPIARTGMFPSGANQMIRVGEATGTLDTQLDSAADFYSRELNYRLKRFTDMFEPAIILVVGIVVGFVAIALVSAMYGIYNQVNI